jgi:hypothetical protein
MHVSLSIEALRMEAVRRPHERVISIRQVVRRLGGPSHVARRLSEMGRPIRTQAVSEWVNRGAVPFRWLAPLQEIAIERGRPLTIEEVLGLSRFIEEERMRRASRERRDGDDGQSD